MSFKSSKTSHFIMNSLFHISLMTSQGRIKYWILSQTGTEESGKNKKSWFFLLGLKYTLRTWFESKNILLKSCPELSNQVLSRLVGHFAYCATPLSLMSFKLSKTFNYQPLFFHSPTQNENVKKVQSVFLPNWNWLFLLIFSLFKVEKIKIHDWSTAEVSSWISQLCSSN